MNDQAEIVYNDIVENEWEGDFMAFIEDTQPELLETLLIEYGKLK